MFDELLQTVLDAIGPSNEGDPLKLRILSIVGVVVFLAVLVTLSTRGPQFTTTGGRVFGLAIAAVAGRVFYLVGKHIVLRRGRKHE